MTKRRKWTAIPGLIALATAAVVLSAYSGASSSQGSQPEQPINFPHTVHVQQLGMNCLYCHYTANKSMDPGMPALSTCMGCHLVIGPQRPAIPGVRKTAYKSTEIQKLWDYYKNGQGKPVPWVRIHKVPEYVHFPHMRHVNAGVTCQTCHGQIQKMPRVYQYASLNMGWCVGCHVNGYSPKEGLEAAGYTAQQQATPTAAGAVTPADAQSGERKKARYDCANCHY